ncbi:DinB family protein [Catenulispora rubra]|uniref:DinB family protein n=1 Tax=Catenulispora rubra TaxID=280293 RepID=UPI0018927E84|nr:DinB family protein [Catenulispora rubra]
MADHDPITHDVLRTFEDVRSRTFARLEGLTDAEYLWQPVPECMTIRRTDEGVYRADSRLPKAPSSPDARDARDATDTTDSLDNEADDPAAPVTTIAWRMWHIGSDCLRGYLSFFEDVPALGDPFEWPGTADRGILAMEEDWARFITRIEGLGDERLMQPMGPRAEEFADASFLALALHALDEVAHHGGELGLLRDLYLREGA